MKACSQAFFLFNMTHKPKIAKKDTPKMFDGIAGTYDKLNHILSFGMDKRWRRVFVKNIAFQEYRNIADIASGTGDLLVELQKLSSKKYYAVDPAAKMLEIAKSKLPHAEFIVSGAESLPLDENSIDLITVSFGIRNFADLGQSFSEFYRVLNTGGIVSIMEFARPKFFLFRWGHRLYLRLFLPIIGRLVSRDKKAYKYLQASIFDFAKNVDVIQLLEAKGFTKRNVKKLLLGSVNIYTVVK
ncbi:MAG: bifunctional demethylmenaquinone methyltransferase/2-methoxy-6-polyprenyl-1,4-benzoquinol methylase UbiE [Marinilabiliales bacterium]|nr:MAG: bifunctional demethylmenaquinone methyltransferase/2-methoxy-6-polyprenyl-1,4-benzoquinol methylase UbiE [Marinilabiliales bacterium]